MRIGKILIVVGTLGAAVAAGTMVLMAVRKVSPVVTAKRASSPLDALTPDERALYDLVDRSVVAPIELWLNPPERPLPGEKVDRWKRLLAEFEMRASMTKIRPDGLASRLASMGAKVRSLRGIGEDAAAIAALAAGDFGALREPAEGTSTAWRVWLALGKSHLAGWQIPELVKSMERAIALWPAGANPEWRRSVVINYARALQWQERFAESEALLRKNGPPAGGAKWPDGEVGLWANELCNQLSAQGKYAEAEPQSRRVLEISEKTYGLVHANVATSSANLAYLVARLGKNEESIRLIERARAVAEKTVPPGDHRQFDWVMFQGTMLMKQNKAGEAADLFERALAGAQKQYGTEHYIVIQLRQLTADAMRQAGMRGTADRLENEALSDFEDLIRETDPARAGVLSARARALFNRHDFAGAERLLRRAVELLDKGGSPFERSSAYVQLCEVLIIQRRFLDAKPLAERAVAQTEAARGEAAPELVRLLQVLAIIRAREGKPALGKLLFDRSLSIAEKNNGQGSPEALAVLQQMALFETTEGHLAEGEKLFRRILAGHQKLSGLKSRDSVAATFMLAGSIEHQGRTKEALPLIEEGLKVAETVLPANDPDLAGYLIRMARVYQNLNRHAEAKPIARRAFELLMTIRGPEHPDTANAAATLSTTLFAQGDDEDAVKLLRIAVAISVKNPGSMHSETPNWYLQLAHILVGKGAYEEADPLSSAALALYEGQFPPDHPALMLPLARRGELLLLRGHPAEAEPVMRRALTIASRDLKPGSPVPPNLAMMRTVYLRILSARGMSEKDAEARIRATLPRAK